MTNTALSPDIVDTLERMRRAWDAGDATAYAEEFTENATYVIYAGLISHGRAQILADHIPVFERWQRGSRMSMKVLDVRTINDDTAVVLTEGGVGKRGTSAVRHNKVQTYVMVREAGQWRCAAFQNTKRNRLFAAINARMTRQHAAQQ
ncbi:SgcJ/EcaC family oxidoreductase [Cumulibacter soli]|uniref:SgcJ/EcaC family oxidoreductase n=1 Tax=Cumulibacter soli TaxID=2546344 RepID=UPI001067F681|nr:SgcJ/EcaC family oxidoreductase [Cumulibacter soli]